MSDFVQFVIRYCRVNTVNVTLLSDSEPCPAFNCVWYAMRVARAIVDLLLILYSEENRAQNEIREGLFETTYVAFTHRNLARFKNSAQ